MNPKDIPRGTAVVVDLIELSLIKENDSVLLGVRGWINGDGDFIPYDESLQIFRKELNNSIGENVLILKRKK